MIETQKNEAFLSYLTNNDSDPKTAKVEGKILINKGRFIANKIIQIYPDCFSRSSETTEATILINGLIDEAKFFGIICFRVSNRKLTKIRSAVPPKWLI